MRTSGLSRSTSGTTDRPSAVSPTTSKSGWISRRHLMASRTTFWSSASTIRGVTRPAVLSPFFTVSVVSTLPSGQARGPQKEYAQSTHRVYSYTYECKGRTFIADWRRDVQESAKVLSVGAWAPRSDADLGMARRSH